MQRQLLYLSQAEVVAAGVTMAEIIDALDTAFREKGEGRVEMPPKPGVHPGGGDNFIHAMPAYVPALGSVGIKWVSGFSGNRDLGLPYIAGLLILNDTVNGLPLAVMDCVWITGVRTGAASALAARYLARPDSAVLGILGCGVQARTHVAAMTCLFPIEKVIAYDTHPDRSELFASEVREQYDLQGVAIETPQGAVSGCDIVVTAGPISKEPHATIQRGWLDRGAFASLVDFDSYWHPMAMAEADLFTTDDVAQFRHYQGLGYFREVPEIHADLGELVISARTGRQNSEQRTMACNLGLAIDDMAVAPLVLQKALEKGLGTRLPL